MANAADNYQFDANNVFDDYDLNPLAQRIGAGADGVRDALSAKRNDFLQPKMQEYRAQVGDAASAADDYGLFHDQNFQNYVKTGALPPQQPQTVTQAWSDPNAAPGLTPGTGTPGANPQTNQQSDELYNLLKSRATQSLTADPNDPEYAGQVDTYRAEQTRNVRDQLADLAEKSSPNANLRAESRMLNEGAAQNTSGFASQLVGRLMQQKRDEIAQAIQQMGSTLSQDKQLELQGLLASLDNQIKGRSLDLQDKGLDLDLRKALMSNDEFLRSLGLQEWIAGNNDYYRRAGI